MVFVELPDIGAKSTYQVAHAAFLDALGLEKAREWMMRFERCIRLTRGQVHEFTQSGDVAEAFENLITRGDGSRIAWDWLRGIALSSTEARLVGLPTVLTQSTSARARSANARTSLA